MANESVLVKAAMAIILDAGDARNYIQGAVKAYVRGDVAEMEANFARAEAAIRQAHQSQTEVVQAEAAGEQFDYSLLMTHAMDTLMTIMSELHQTKNMIMIDRKDG